MTDLITWEKNESGTDNTLAANKNNNKQKGVVL